MADSNRKICIVMVHYGNVEITKQSLTAIAQLTVTPYVVITNNDSHDDGLKLAAHIQKMGDTLQAEVVSNRSNGGFAAGCNIGIRKAQTLHAKYVWLLNNDTEVEPDSLEKLLKCADTNPKAIIGSSVVGIDTPNIIQVAGGVGYNAFTTVISPAHVGKSIEEIPSLLPEKMDYIYGASMLVPSVFFKDYGEMDESFFLYYEELDLCTKAVKAGYILNWCKQSIVRHHGGAAIGAKSGNNKGINRFSIFHETRSAILLTAKHFPLFLLPALASRIFIKPLYLISRGQWHMTPTVWKAAVSGLIDSISSH